MKKPDRAPVIPSSDDMSRFQRIHAIGTTRRRHTKARVARPHGQQQVIAQVLDYGASKLAEEVLAAGAQVVILDVVGVWYGLRLAADGKGAGIETPISDPQHGNSGFHRRATGSGNRS